jgi:hypothetical protein
VKTILRSLMLWLVLLAVPFQGFAAATMLPCAPSQAHVVAAVANGGHAMHHAGEHAAMRHGASHGEHDGSASHQHHAHGKCASCAACCIGAALAPAPLATFALAAPASLSVPFRGGHIPSVHPPVPERPPSASLA